MINERNNVHDNIKLNPTHIDSSITLSNTNKMLALSSNVFLLLGAFDSNMNSSGKLIPQLNSKAYA